MKPDRRETRGSRATRKGIRRLNGPLSPLLALLSLLLMFGSCGQTSPPATIARTAPPACDINYGACEGNSAWGRFTISVTPQPVPVLVPVTVELRFHTPGDAEATLDLAGAEMDMGPNRVPLQRVDARTRRGQFVIPVCLTGSMRWRLTLILNENNRGESIDYEFIAPVKHHEKANTPP